VYEGSSESTNSWSPNEDHGSIIISPTSNRALLLGAVPESEPSVCTEVRHSITILNGVGR